MIRTHYLHESERLRKKSLEIKQFELDTEKQMKVNAYIADQEALFDKMSREYLEKEGEDV